ncbi:MAG: DegT/DnrJ/EryC1/StrS family aminotransferase [Acidimicrobiales bacterium]
MSVLSELVPTARSKRSIPVMRPTLGPEEAVAASEAVLSGWVAQGPRVAQFEEAFARRVGAAHAVAVSSCTTALHLALVVAGIGPGHDVLVPSLSFIATANAVRYVGAHPVFADVDPITQNLTVESIRSALTPATRAVIVVDQGGVPAELDPIRVLCDPLGVTVIQDAACAIGSTYAGQPVGARAELAAFSFHPRKVITTGEGGMLVTSNEEWAARCRRLREHGMNVSAADRHLAQGPVLEAYVETGFNYRMTDVQAAIGLVQLSRLDLIVSRRRLLAQRYQRKLVEIPQLEQAIMAADPGYGTTNFQSFWVCLPDEFPVERNHLLGILADHGVSARRGIMASHLEPAYAGHPHQPLPVTERLTERSLILPLFHDLTEADQDLVVDVIATAAERRS